MPLLREPDPSHKGTQRCEKIGVLKLPLLAAAGAAAQWTRVRPRTKTRRGFERECAIKKFAKSNPYLMPGVVLANLPRIPL